MYSIIRNIELLDSSNEDASLPPSGGQVEVPQLKSLTVSCGSVVLKGFFKVLSFFLIFFFD